MSGLAPLAILAPIESYLGASGLFDRVCGHEPKNAPGRGLTAACWLDEVAPLPSRSGLAITSAIVVLKVRIYSATVFATDDTIEPGLLLATNQVLSDLSGGFTFGGNVDCVDLGGMSGYQVSAKAGYLNQDSKIFRVMTITLPLVVDDVWAQVA